MLTSPKAKSVMATFMTSFQVVERKRIIYNLSGAVIELQNGFTGEAFGGVTYDKKCRQTLNSCKKMP